ncbi:hypothetical protein BCR44DRAFT_1432952 [Catenaria anguillulae PL171]|uniref:Galactose oxidase n=1 Tax=Catenaria anguillulae PL171 TaxID=765915 RepID=A0A1Y2HSS3_9FUNG|nr:hypothetical protein BCR44DRAFT_1432952 [Catenaria anguillulae PL171]
MLSATKLITQVPLADPATKATITKLAPSPRTGSSTVPTPDGRFLVFGGASAEEGLSNDLYELSIDTVTETASWKPLNHLHSGALPMPRYDHAAFFIDNQMIVMGGAGPDGSCLNDVWVYDIASYRWDLLKTSGGAPSPRTMRGAATLHPQDSNKILVWGGGADGSRAVQDSSVHVLDIAALSWTTYAVSPAEATSSVPPPRLGHSLVSCTSAHAVYLLGGMNADTIFDDLWTLSLDSWKWTRLATHAAFAVSGHAALALDRFPRLASPKAITNATQVSSSQAIILWAGGLTKSMAVSDKWYVASASTNWEPHTVPLAKAMAADRSMARLDHCLFVIPDSAGKSGISEIKDGEPVGADEHEGMRVGMFGGMNHGGVFHDVHVLNLDGCN